MSKFILFSTNEKIKNKTEELFELLKIDVDNETQMEFSPRDYGNIGDVSLDYMIYINNLKLASDSNNTIVCLDNNSYSNFVSAMEFAKSKLVSAFKFQKFLKEENISVDKFKSNFIHINDIILKNIKEIKEKTAKEEHNFKYALHCGSKLELNKNQKIANETIDILKEIYPNFKYITSTYSFNSGNSEEKEFVVKNLVDSGAEFVVGYDSDIFNILESGSYPLPKDYVSDGVKLDYLHLAEVILKRFH